MVFQSFHFILFFFVVLIFVRVVFKKSDNSKKNILLVASYYFYMCWDWRFSFLIFSITLINYLIGPKIYQAKNKYQKKIYLSLSISISLLILAYFKYFNFFIESFNEVLSLFGFHNEISYLNILLPVGISFYTFQSISYTLDIYRERTSPVSSFRDFALFVAFFPQLVAGPIVRASHFLPQLKSDYTEETEQPIESGLALMIRGFVKKILIADILALHIIDPAFADPSLYSSAFLLIALYAYSYQVYMDFSGYTDIARGAARCMGYELQINFNRPYLATSVGNFWQRWHISMSSFFRDYLYFGLGGSKYGNVYRNLFLTFIMIGIWHGAGWNFIVYGAIHALMICWERWRRERRKAKGVADSNYSTFGTVLQIAMVFNLISFSRVLFRGGSIEHAIGYMGSMLSFSGSRFPLGALGFVALLAAVLMHYTPQSWSYKWKHLYCKIPAFAQAIIIAFTIYLTIILSTGSAPFIYFQF